MIRDLPTEAIDIRSDARAIDGATVDGLAESIAEVGLINPIRVRAVGDRWEVIAGAHRLSAVKQLGLTDIAAIVVTDDDLRAELAMIDENLCRAELSPSDRARQTARRKAIYLELHPETAAGIAGATVRWNADDKMSVASFAAETAKISGKDERSVQRDVARGEKVIAPALDIIKGTPLDTGTYLDKLKKLGPNEQVVAAKRDLAHIRQQQRENAKKGIQRRVVKIADDPLTDEEAEEKQYAALVAAWNKAGDKARQRFRELMDTPVFDHSRAA